VVGPRAYGFDTYLFRGAAMSRGCQPDSIGVIGAGPAGLSFAYQMARRGYPVTIYEKQERPGGMLQFGIPEYRLPAEVLAAEVNRILPFCGSGCRSRIRGALTGIWPRPVWISRSGR